MDVPAHAGAAASPGDAAADGFFLGSAERTLVARGAEAYWSTPLSAGLAEEVAAGLALRGAGAVAVGALPFDPARPSHLLLPRRVERLEGAVDAGAWMAEAAAPLGADRWRVTPEPASAEYEAAVARALRRMEAGASPEGLRKVVLARSLVVESAGEIRLGPLLRALQADRSATVFATPLPTPAGGARRTLVGASPELLVSKRGRAIGSTPLAGSARRDPHPARDEAAAAALARSEKDRREHAAVVEWIADRLAPYCRRLRVPREPSVVSTRSMWHLGTRIDGELRDPDVPSLTLLAALHPTPAVCGFPAEAAREVIGALEPFDRDYFAGAVGWCDAAGDGEWMLAIRCAEVAGARARLYAGAGIVLGSDPAAEAGETSAKFQTMLRALGLDEEGRPLPEAP